jgi:TonB-linked SusC/RagA family outer membrane protein
MKKLLPLLLLLCPLALLAQPTRQISGQVVDSNGGQPLPGATVFIAPSPDFADYNPQGAVADSEGRFSLVLPSGVTSVVVNYLGYEALTADISGRSSFTFRLNASATTLADVVVTGYQSIEKRKVTSSIANIAMDKIAQAGVPSVDQLLSGQIAGVVAVPTSGAPGAGTKLNIRGTVTLNGVSDPLWVLDGIALEGNEIPRDWSTAESIDKLYNVSIAGLNPSDIDNITILKDAAATAIYGARAANGVIVITTKKGKRNETLRVNANAAVFVTARPDIAKLNLMNASQKVDLELALAANGRLNNNRSGGGVARILDGAGERQTLIDNGYNSLSQSTKSAIDALRANGTDWAREIYRPALNQQYSLSLSGGGDRSGYYVSGGYFNERGTTVGTGFDRLTLTMKMDWDIARKLNFGASVFVGRTTNKSYISDRYAFMNPNRYTRNVNPYLNARDADGGYIYDPDMAASATDSEDMIAYNYFEERANTNHEMKTGSVKALFDLTYRPVDGLDLSTQFGLQNDNSKTQKDADANSYFTRQYAYRSRINQVSYLPEGGVIQNTDNSMSQYTWRAQAEYGRTFARKHEIDILGGVELRGATNENLYTQGFGYDRKTLRTIAIVWPNNERGQQMANSADFIPSRHSFYENRYLSYYATGSYTFDNRYVFFGSLRYDGTNLFGVDPKYRYTPLWSLSGAWNINRESWFDNASWLNTLRLRASYGKQGNVDRNTSPYVMGNWNTAAPGGAVEDVIDVSSPPNQNLRWETTGMWNAALEMSVLDNRLGAVFEIYGTRSKDLITVRQIPYETGFMATTTNYGEISGKGWELTLNSVNVRTRDFRWETSLTLAHNSSTIEKEFRGDQSWLPSREGYSPGAIFGFRTAGLDDHGVPMFWKNGEKVSLEKFVGYRYNTYELFPGYPVTEPAMDNTQADVRANMSYLGTTEPRLTGGFNNRFSFRGFDLAVSCNFVIQQTVMRTPFYNALAMNPGVNYSTEMSKVWSETNKVGIYPVITGIRRPNGEAWSEITPDDSDPQRVMYWIMDNYGSGVNMFNNLDLWATKMSYLRVNSIRLGYTLPSDVVRRVGMQSLRVNFEVRNPFVIATDYKGYFDPETYGNIYSQPIPRVYSLGLNMTF